MEKAIKVIMETTAELLREAKTDEEKIRILQAQNMSIQALVKQEDETVNDTQKNYSILSEAIKTNNISAEELLDAFTNWYGLQLLDDELMEFLKDEQIIY